MTKRLQVLLDDEELLTIQQLAKARHTTTAEWVRGALRVAVEVETRPASAVKLAALRRAAVHAFPTADIDQLLAETERGYLEPGG
jgi:predicted transcriptional regulator